MKRLASFLKTTIAGGVFFLIPIIVVIALGAKGFMMLRQLSVEIAEKLPITHIAGVGVITLVTVSLLLFVCFVAGIFMRTDIAHKVKRWIEEDVLIYVPAYSYIQALSTD